MSAPPEDIRTRTGISVRKTKDGHVQILLWVEGEGKGVSLTPAQARQFGEQIVQAANEIVLAPHAKKKAEAPPVPS